MKDYLGRNVSHHGMNRWMEPVGINIKHRVGPLMSVSCRIRESHVADFHGRGRTINYRYRDVVIRK